MGEGPIYAHTDEAGIELMKLKYSTREKAVMPAQNQAGIDFLTQYGFSKQLKTGMRMVLGQPIHWQPEKNV